jgi:hypothetical protein
MIGDAELLGDISQVLMVADDAGDFHLPFTGLVPCQEVIQAMAHLAHENRHPGLFITEIDPGMHIITYAQFLFNRIVDAFPRDGESVQVPFDAHEKTLIDPVNVLVEIYDITVVMGYESRDIRYNTLPVRTMQKQNRSWFNHLVLGDGYFNKLQI